MCSASIASVHLSRLSPLFFFLNHTPTPEIYTLSLHDALPISMPARPAAAGRARRSVVGEPAAAARASARSGLRAGAPHRAARDRKSTRLNSSHLGISYAVFCLKKKKHDAGKSVSDWHPIPSNE